MAGRPLKYQTPEELQEAIDEYFNGNDRITLAGLAVYLDMCRKSLYNYAEKDEFLHMIKKARDKVEAHYEERLIYENTPTGVIFALKNMSWKDKQEFDHTTQGDRIQGSPIIVSNPTGERPESK